MHASCCLGCEDGTGCVGCPVEQLGDIGGDAWAAPTNIGYPRSNFEIPGFPKIPNPGYDNGVSEAECYTRIQAAKAQALKECQEGKSPDPWAKPGSGWAWTIVAAVVGLGAGYGVARVMR